MNKLVILAVSAFATSSVAETLRYQFSEASGELQGWTVVSGEVEVADGGLTSAKVKDEAHATVLVRSPMFRLDPEPKLSVTLKSGKGGPIPTSPRALAAETSDPGPMGIALRRVTDDAWIMTGRLSKDGSQELITFPADELAALHEAAADEVYTLDFFDAEHGGWGHLQLIETTIKATLVEALPKPPAGFENARPLFLGALHGKLSFDKKNLYATPGSKVSLSLFNTDEMAHNWVLCQPDPKVADELGAYVMENLEAMIEADYVPKDPRILYHSRLVAPGTSDTQYFTVPEKKGDYPYVCTFPGHHLLMRGVLHVVDELPLPSGDDVQQIEPLDPYLITAKDRPAIIRGPLAGGTGGHAVVCVGLPGGISFSFDTTSCQISNVWIGEKKGFLNAREAWGGRGGKALKIVGQIQHQNKNERPPGEVKFRSYVIAEDGLPTFEFLENGVPVRVRAEPGEGALLIQHQSGTEETRTEKIKLP